jgi:hypothetical protein
LAVGECNRQALWRARTHGGADSFKEVSVADFLGSFLLAAALTPGHALSAVPNRQA